MPCKHAALAMIYAKQMAEMDEPWKLWEHKAKGIEGQWYPVMGHPMWIDAAEYRQIPKTLSINGIDVPEPMRERPDIGTKYWHISIDDDFCDWTTWQDDDLDNKYLKLGLCHLSKQNAECHAKALFSFSEVG